MLDRQDVINRIGDGKIFRVTFVKADGSLRNMVCRTGVVTGLKGGQKAFDDAEKNIVTVWDLQKGAYRSFRVDRVIELKEHGSTTVVHKPSIQSREG